MTITGRLIASCEFLSRANFMQVHFIASVPAFLTEFHSQWIPPRQDKTVDLILTRSVRFKVASLGPSQPET
jgi:hypothetical protein